MSQSVLIIGGGSRIAQAIAQQCSAEDAVVSVISRQSAPVNTAWLWYQDALQSADSSQHCSNKPCSSNPRRYLSAMVCYTMQQLCQKKPFAN